MLTYSSLGLSDHALLHVDIVDIYIVTAHVREWGGRERAEREKGRVRQRDMEERGGGEAGEREKGRRGERERVARETETD